MKRYALVLWAAAACAADAPTAKQVVQAVLRNQDVPLTVHSSCRNVGSEPGDATIGDFLSGFLAEQNDAQSGNAIQASCKPAKGKQGAGLWDCELQLRHAKGEDVWTWGVAFAMRGKDRAAIRTSFRCLGAG